MAKIKELLLKQIQTFIIHVSTVFIIKSSIVSLISVSDIYTVIFAICVKKVDINKAQIAGDEKLQKQAKASN